MRQSPEIIANGGTIDVDQIWWWRDRRCMSHVTGAGELRTGQAGSFLQGVKNLPLRRHGIGLVH
jgi:hypothetical protein